MVLGIGYRNSLPVTKIDIGVIDIGGWSILDAVGGSCLDDCVGPGVTVGRCSARGQCTPCDLRSPGNQRR